MNKKYVWILIAILGVGLLGGFLTQKAATKAKEDAAKAKAIEDAQMAVAAPPRAMPAAASPVPPAPGPKIDKLIEAARAEAKAAAQATIDVLTKEIEKLKAAAAAAPPAGPGVGGAAPAGGPPAAPPGGAPAPAPSGGPGAAGAAPAAPTMKSPCASPEQLAAGLTFVVSELRPQETQVLWVCAKTRPTGEKKIPLPDAPKEGYTLDAGLTSLKNAGVLDVKLEDAPKTDDEPYQLTVNVNYLEKIKKDGALFIDAAGAAGKVTIPWIGLYGGPVEIPISLKRDTRVNYAHFVYATEALHFKQAAPGAESVWTVTLTGAGAAAGARPIQTYDLVTKLATAALDHIVNIQKPFFVVNNLPFAVAPGDNCTILGTPGTLPAQSAQAFLAKAKAGWSAGPATKSLTPKLDGQTDKYQVNTFSTTCTMGTALQNFTLYNQFYPLVEETVDPPVADLREYLLKADSIAETLYSLPAGNSVNFKTCVSNACACPVLRGALTDLKDTAQRYLNIALEDPAAYGSKTFRFGTVINAANFGEDCLKGTDFEDKLTPGKIQFAAYTADLKDFNPAAPVSPTLEAAVSAIESKDEKLKEALTKSFLYATPDGLESGKNLYTLSLLATPDVTAYVGPLGQKIEQRLWGLNPRETGLASVITGEVCDGQTVSLEMYRRDRYELAAAKKGVLVLGSETYFLPIRNWTTKMAVNATAPAAAAALPPAAPTPLSVTWPDAKPSGCLLAYSPVEGLNPAKALAGNPIEIHNELEARKEYRIADFNELGRPGTPAELATLQQKQTQANQQIDGILGKIGEWNDALAATPMNLEQAESLRAEILAAITQFNNDISATPRLQKEYGDFFGPSSTMLGQVFVLSPLPPEIEKIMTDGGRLVWVATRANGTQVYDAVPTDITSNINGALLMNANYIESTPVIAGAPTRKRAFYIVNASGVDLDDAGEWTKALKPDSLIVGVTNTARNKLLDAKNKALEPLRLALAMQLGKDNAPPALLTTDDAAVLEIDSMRVAQPYGGFSVNAPKAVAKNEAEARLLTRFGGDGLATLAAESAKFRDKWNSFKTVEESQAMTLSAPRARAPAAAPSKPLFVLASAKLFDGNPATPFVLVAAFFTESVKETLKALLVARVARHPELAYVPVATHAAAPPLPPLGDVSTPAKLDPLSEEASNAFLDLSFKENTVTLYLNPGFYPVGKGLLEDRGGNTVEFQAGLLEMEAWALSLLEFVSHDTPKHYPKSVSLQYGDYKAIDWGGGATKVQPDKVSIRYNFCEGKAGKTKVDDCFTPAYLENEWKWNALPKPTTSGYTTTYFDQPLQDAYKVGQCFKQYEEKGTDTPGTCGDTFNTNPAAFPLRTKADTETYRYYCEQAHTCSELKLATAPETQVAYPVKYKGNNVYMPLPSVADFWQAEENYVLGTEGGTDKPPYKLVVDVMNKMKVWKPSASYDGEDQLFQNTMLKNVDDGSMDDPLTYAPSQINLFFNRLQAFDKRAAQRVRTWLNPDPSGSEDMIVWDNKFTRDWFNAVSQKVRLMKVDYTAAAGPLPHSLFYLRNDKPEDADYWFAWKCYPQLPPVDPREIAESLRCWDGHLETNTGVYVR